MISKGAGRVQPSRRGSVVVLVAVSLVTLIAFVGLLIDGAVWYDAQILLQSIADQAALAGALKMPSMSQASTAALNVVLANGGLSTEVYSSQPIGTTQYEVILKRQQPAIFTAVAGFSSVQISVRSLAQIDTGSGGGGGTTDPFSNTFYVGKEFQSGTTPDVFQWTGGSSNVYGSMQINMSFALTGNSCNFNGPVNVGHNINITGSSDNFPSGRTANAPTVAKPTLDTSGMLSTAKAAGTYYVYSSGSWKQWNPATGALVTPAVPPAGWTFSGSNLTCTASNKTISGTVYLQGGGVTITGNNLNGTATIFTDQTIAITGSNMTMNSGANIGFISTSSSNSAITITGNNSSYTGAFVALNGGFTFTGGSSDFHGGIYCWDIGGITGNSTNFYYDDDQIERVPVVSTAAKTVYHLVQ